MSSEPNCVDRIIAALEAQPVAVTDARRPPAAGGVPDQQGFYAWWALAGALPEAEGLPHPSKPELRAFYVGISPVREGTAQRLRGRIVGNHIGGNTSGSTFRFALASLLLETRGYEPCCRIDSKGRQKYVLTAHQNDDLRSWQNDHLRVTWTICDQPWREGLEEAVIAHFRPPLNSAKNSHHPFHATLRDARRRFRAAANRCP